MILQTRTKASFQRKDFLDSLKYHFLSFFFPKIKQTYIERNKPKGILIYFIPRRIQEHYTRKITRVEKEISSWIIIKTNQKYSIFYISRKIANIYL